MEHGDIDRLVQRAVAGITSLARRASGFATRLLLGTLIVCGGGFLLGVAALSGGVETVWIVLGIVFGTIAVGSAAVARWRLGSVRRHAPQLADEVRAMLTEGRAGSRTVIDTFAVGDDGSTADGGSPIVLSRQLHGFRDASGGVLDRSTRLGAAVTALTTFPLLIVAASLISLVFAFLGFVFLIALAL